MNDSLCNFTFSSLLLTPVDVFIQTLIYKDDEVMKINLIRRVDIDRKKNVCYFFVIRFCVCI